MTEKMMRRAFLISILVLSMSPIVLPQAQPQNPTTPTEEPPSVLTVPKEYRYNARGRRDPFVNPVPKPKPTAATPQAPIVRPPGLKGVLVSEAQIIGVVTSKEPSMNVVVLGAPGAKASYFAHVGDQLFDASVRRISIDTVTFALNSPGPDPNAPREIVRKVRPKPGEEK